MPVPLHLPPDWSGAPATRGTIACDTVLQTPEGRLSVLLQAKKGGRVSRYTFYWAAGSERAIAQPFTEGAPVRMEAWGSWDGAALRYRTISARVTYSQATPPEAQPRRMAVEGYRVVLALSDGLPREVVVAPPKRPPSEEVYGVSAPHAFNVSKVPVAAIAGPMTARVVFADGSTPTGFELAQATPLLPPDLARLLSENPFAWNGRAAWTCGPRPWK